jgi:aconitate hydratase
LDLSDFKPNAPITAELRSSDGNATKIVLSHTFNAQQIAWFKAGSALNLIAAKN